MVLKYCYNNHVTNILPLGTLYRLPRSFWPISITAASFSSQFLDSRLDFTYQVVASKFPV